MRKTYFNWSSGKDSSMALFEILKSSKFAVKKLITTVNGENDRVSMHGLSKDLLIKQAKATGIPLEIINIPGKINMEEYDEIMRNATEKLKEEGFTDCVFGDIFLEDLRKYREERLKDFTCHFPIWQKDTRTLIKDFIKNGFQAITVCIDNQKLDESFLGCLIDEDFINRLPKDVDPCGENGEFHTFCFDGPIFNAPIAFEKGEKVFKEYEHDGKKFGFWFLDLK
jgi:uncharacterized protein (TIGR00290 family)